MLQLQGKGLSIEARELLHLLGNNKTGSTASSPCVLQAAVYCRQRQEVRPGLMVVTFGDKSSRAGVSTRIFGGNLVFLRSGDL